MLSIVGQRLVLISMDAAVRGGKGRFVSTLLFVLGNEMWFQCLTEGILVGCRSQHVVPGGV